MSLLVIVAVSVNNELCYYLWIRRPNPNCNLFEDMLHIEYTLNSVNCEKRYLNCNILTAEETGNAADLLE